MSPGLLTPAAIKKQNINKQIKHTKPTCKQNFRPRPREICLPRPPPPPPPPLSCV